MKIIRKTAIISIITAAAFALNVSASVLGSVKINGYTVEIGRGASATHNTWYSDQSGVEQQTENYIVYSPNSGTEPIITNGSYIYGTSTISSEVARIRANGIVPLAGTNADFFSFQTGVPMSNIISDGEILAKDESNQYAVGYLEDNSAFMSKITIYTTLKRADGSLFRIHNVNKYRQPYSIYMFTDKFSTQTHNKTNGYDVILGDVSGSLKIGSEITATVESVDEYNGSIAIPSGKLVISVDANAPEEYVNAVTSLNIGEKVSISIGAEGDERWDKAKIIIGAYGGMLIENGVINPSLEAGANPRTALGIMEDGSTLLYTIDGRQKGYSYGVQLKTLAARMAELGCVDAINLDGGGSTSFVLQFPGDSVTTLNNRPSEGSLRAVSNFMFFKNNLSKTGVIKSLTIYPLNSYVLTGASTQLSVKASDTGYYAMEVPSDLTYTVEDGAMSTVSPSGLFTANDNKAVTVYASAGGVTTAHAVMCIQTPTNISVINEATSSAVSSLTLKRTDSVNLSANAYAGYNMLTATDKNFNWSCDPEIGAIDSLGTFTAADVLKASGNIYVNAGEKTVSIPVNVTRTGAESEDELYTSFDVEKNDLDYKITLTSNFGMSVSSGGIIVKADGKYIAYSLEENILTFTAPQGTDKISVFVTNTEGFTSFYTDILNNEVYENPFIDTKGNWAENIISYMYKNKIINGEPTKDGFKFNPAKPMTRSEFAVMTAKYLDINLSEYKNVSLPYADADKIPDWALDSFKALYSLEIMQGSANDGKLYGNPYGNITRAEVATLIARSLPSGVKVSKITSSDKSDVPGWASEGIGKLISLGAIGGYTDGTIKPLSNVAKAEALKILYTIM